MARVVRSNPRFVHARIGNSRRGILGGGVVATHVRGGELVYDRHGDECVRAMGRGGRVREKRTRTGREKEQRGTRRERHTDGEKQRRRGQGRGD